jgi:hypothetical protein
MPPGRRPGAEDNLGEEVTPGYWSPRRTLSVMDADGALLLLREILADLPRLHGASCVGQYALFDPVVDNGRRHRDQERARLAKTATILRYLPRPGAVHQRHRGRHRGSHPSTATPASTTTRSAESGHCLLMA